MSNKKITQKAILIRFFSEHPCEDIPTEVVVDWVTAEYKKLTGNIFRDPDRGVRTLYQEGFLIKVRQGVYRHDPSAIQSKSLEEFSEPDKKEILKRGNYKCAICGHGVEEGMTLHVDHIKPRELGGTAELDNGQVLCSRHNMFKKTLKQTETGKKMFINLYKLAKKSGDIELMRFCESVLLVYDEHDINGHIVWEK